MDRGRAEAGTSFPPLRCPAVYYPCLCTAVYSTYLVMHARLSVVYWYSKKVELSMCGQCWRQMPCTTEHHDHDHDHHHQQLLDPMCAIESHRHRRHPLPGAELCALMSCPFPSILARRLRLPLPPPAIPDATRAKTSSPRHRVRTLHCIATRQLVGRDGAA